MGSQEGDLHPDGHKLDDIEERASEDIRRSPETGGRDANQSRASQQTVYDSSTPRAPSDDSLYGLPHRVFLDQT
jgi:hypothetical protein